MKKLPLFVSVVFLISAIISCYGGYRNAAHCMRQDLDQALAYTIAYRGIEVMRQDSIRAYKAMSQNEGSQLTIILEDKVLRGHLRQALVKDVAYIACEVREHEGKYDVNFRSEASCSASMLFSMSDQRLSLVLSMMMAMSLLWSLYPLRKGKGAKCNDSYGGLRYDSASDRFVTSRGSLLHLTPMQHTLMRMFFNSGTRTLSKQTICDTLWPKKPDASDTLYTLIRRLKPIIEEHSDLRIESDRGKSYVLRHNGVG